MQHAIPEEAAIGVGRFPPPLSTQSNIKAILLLIVGVRIVSEVESARVEYLPNLRDLILGGLLVLQRHKLSLSYPKDLAISYLANAEAPSDQDEVQNVLRLASVELQYSQASVGVRYFHILLSHGLRLLSSCGRNFSH